MLQPAVDLCLEEKPSPAPRIASMSCLDLLEGHFAVDLFIVSNKHLPESTPGVWTKYPIPRRYG
jgi:hypothetical protein